MKESGFVVLEIESLIFYSPRDEENLFDWLRSVPAVKDIRGSGNTIYVKVEASLGGDDLSELISVFTRYGISMGQFAVFDDGRFPWFRVKEMFWYEPVFGQ